MAIMLSNENGRGIALVDLNNDDHLDITCGNWEGNHCIFLQLKAKSVRRFRNVAFAFFEHPSPIRMVIVADFDNDIQTDIFSESNTFVNFSPSVHVTIIDRAAYCPSPKWATGSISHKYPRNS
jgi:hypothetical protein